jgi:glycosyltransferase involved in cell wall biosynthesis
VGDPCALAGAIRRVLRDKPLRDRLIAAGLATVREKFSWETILPLYGQILAKPGNKAPLFGVNPN